MRSELQNQIIQTIKSFMKEKRVPGLAFGLVDGNEPVLVKGMVGFCSSFTHFLEEKITVIPLYNYDLINLPHELPHQIVRMYLRDRGSGSWDR